MGSTAGIVLAGGKSSRFGSDKASALFRGRPLLAWVGAALEDACDEVIVVAAEGQAVPAIGSRVRFVRDAEPGLGPLVGALSGLDAAAGAERVFLASCDAPLLSPALVADLMARVEGGVSEAAVPIVDGLLQPLVAAYRADPLRRALLAARTAGRMSLMAALDHLAVMSVSASELEAADPRLLSFRNLNNAGALALLESELP